MTRSLTELQPGVPRLSPGQLAGVVFAHAGLLAVLLNAPDTPEPVMPPRPLMVSLLEPEIDTPQRKTELTPQPPKPVVKPLPPLPVLAAQHAAPASSPQPVLESPKPLPEPVAEALPPPAPVVAEAPKPAPPPPPPPTPPQPADYLNNPKPPYPALSRRLGETGIVKLRVLVNADGSVASVELAKSSGFARLDKSAMDTVLASWKFEPARQGGKAVADWVNFPIDFKLNRS
ncbi:MAG: energy transducer TonB [Thiobacillus sp.]|nr:energy transducer TonB [Thiobacillus sp.]